MIAAASYFDSARRLRVRWTDRAWKPRIRAAAAGLPRPVPGALVWRSSPGFARPTSLRSVAVWVIRRLGRNRRTGVSAPWDERFEQPQVRARRLPGNRISF